MSRYQRMLDITKSRIDAGVAMGVGRLRTEDDRLEGAMMTIGGQEVVDFGSCSYLGLNRDPRLAAAATEAIARYGTGHSSSTTYTALGLYSELESRLESVFGASVAVAPTTTLAHLAALPVLILPGDVALVDHQAHASLQMAMDLLRGRGVLVDTLPHNDVAALDAAIWHHRHANRIWYIADGVYSMYGDIAPAEAIHPLLDKYPNLHLYYDDAHGVGWQGVHGRGEILNRVPWHDRMVIAGGLSKSFGANGAVLAFGDADLAKTVAYCGPTFLFSGPIPPASLGAAIASADFHLSDEHPIRQRELNERIALAHSLLVENDLSLPSHDATPIWFVRVGAVTDIIRLVRGLLDDGYYVNPAGYPVVPRGQGGIRFTVTLNQTEGQLRGLIRAIRRRLPDQTEPDITVDLRSTSHHPARKDNALTAMANT
ncbi:MAG: aminotransferase class I/II-fold pyridoxal phosphate-dependent enzyme [Acidimicrobiia bacterium]